MEINYEDFSKLDIRVGLVKNCTKIPKSKNLYKLMVDCGGKDLIQIVTGIAPFYSIEELRLSRSIHLIEQRLETITIIFL